jgi:hypothetical protein
VKAAGAFFATLCSPEVSARWPGMMHFLDNELNFLDNLSVALVRFVL